MHIILEQKLEYYEYLCHSTTIESAREILQAGFIEQIYATVDRENTYREGCRFYFRVNEEEISEDSCLEGGIRCEQEWVQHDQVFCNSVDFHFNATLLRIETEDEVCMQLFKTLQLMMRFL